MIYQHLQKTAQALVGNNRLYGGWGLLVSYYLPGNSCAHPQGHRAGGSTARGVGAQAIWGIVFPPLPPSHTGGAPAGVHLDL